MAQKITPMRKQYLEMKEKCPDCLLFFRLGDFYEMFDEDARIASKVLDLTLTTRDRNKDIPQEEKVPMCGVPYHSYQSYLARLVAKGYKVAICEQTQDPAAATGIVERDIIRIVTPARQWMPPCWRRAGTITSPPSTWRGSGAVCASAICPPVRCTPQLAVGRIV